MFYLALWRKTYLGFQTKAWFHAKLNFQIEKKEWRSLIGTAQPNLPRLYVRLYFLKGGNIYSNRFKLNQPAFLIKIQDLF